MEIHGGQYDKRTQMAIIQFQCDLDRSGNEGFETLVGETVSRLAVDSFGNKTTVPAKAELEDDEQEDGKSMTFVSYGATDDKTDLLRLNWKTKYACEDYEDDEDASKSSSWGFFTWFIIL